MRRNGVAVVHQAMPAAFPEVRRRPARARAFPPEGRAAQPASFGGASAQRDVVVAKVCRLEGSPPAEKKAGESSPNLGMTEVEPALLWDTKRSSEGRAAQHASFGEASAEHDLVVAKVCGLECSTPARKKANESLSNLGMIEGKPAPKPSPVKRKAAKDRYKSNPSGRAIINAGKNVQGKRKRQKRRKLQPN